MHPMHVVYSPRRLAVVLAILSMAASPIVGANPLTMGQAERLALEADPSVAALRSRQQALEELEVAAGQLPDPVIKAGFMSLPTDTFHLGQEAMTQVQVGVVQKFPRGDSRALRSAQLREQGRAVGEAARDLQLRVLLAVREEFLEVTQQQRLVAINDAAEAVFSDLEQITAEYYATGRVQQQDVLRAAVERARVQERAARIAEAEDQARARLGAWIGDAAWQPFEPGWPDLAEPGTHQRISDGLPGHPRVLALEQEVLAARKGVELAEEAHKPEFAVDLSYGGRGGIGPDGGSRPDLLSVMVMMDVPLFTDKRQDRLSASREAEHQAAAMTREDALRRLRSEVELHARSLQRQRERLALFEEVLLPEAQYNANATFEAYQAAQENLTTLMRARITEFDLQLEYVRLQAEAAKSQARLLYLQGETS